MGIIFNVFGGAVFSGYAEYVFEILGMLTFIVGLIAMLRAFLLKERVEQPEQTKI